jgi:hypothetical protein
MMGIRAEGMSTHDILEQEKIIDEIIGKYNSKSKTPEMVSKKEDKQEQQQSKPVGGLSEEEIEKSRQWLEKIMPSNKPQEKEKGIERQSNGSLSEEYIEEARKRLEKVTFSNEKQKEEKPIESQPSVKETMAKEKEKEIESQPKFEKVTNENFERYRQQKKEIMLNGRAWRIDEVNQDGSVFLVRDTEMSEAIRFAEMSLEEGFKSLVDDKNMKVRAIGSSLEELKSRAQWIVENPPRSPENPDRQKEVAEAESIRKRVLSGEFPANKKGGFELLSDIFIKKVTSLNDEKKAYEKTLLINNPK